MASHAESNTPTERRCQASRAPDPSTAQSTTLPGYNVEFIPSERRLLERRTKTKSAP